MEQHNDPYENWRKRQAYYDRKEQESGETIKNIMKTFLVCLAFALLGWLLSGCTTTKYVPVIEYHTDTLMINKTLHDSIWVHDSVMVTQYQKGDTIYQESTKWHTKYVLKEVHDTTYISKTDTVATPYPVEKEVPAELTWWQQTRLHLANILLYLLALCGIIWICKSYIKKFLP